MDQESTWTKSPCRPGVHVHQEPTGVHVDQESIASVERTTLVLGVPRRRYMYSATGVLVGGGGGVCEHTTTQLSLLQNAMSNFVGGVYS